jgi:hypothetical protein
MVGEPATQYYTVVGQDHFRSSVRRARPGDAAALLPGVVLVPLAELPSLLGLS